MISCYKLSNKTQKKYKAKNRKYLNVEMYLWEIADKNGIVTKKNVQLRWKKLKKLKFSFAMGAYRKTDLLVYICETRRRESPQPGW